MTLFDKFFVRSSESDSLYRELRGTGDSTLVFVAGLGGTTRYWASRVAPLEKHHRVVLIDLLGFGDSPKPWTRYSVETHVEALHRALDDLGPITLIGHSLGAMLTVAYAARYPAQIQNIVLIGMPYFGSERRAYRHLRHSPIKGGYLYTNVTLTMAACIFTRRVVGRLLPYLLRNVPREVAEDLVKHTWRSSTSSLWAVVYGYELTGDLRLLPDRIGVMFLHGDRDLIAPLAAARKLAGMRPNARLTVFHDVDHHPLLREPQRCLRLIESFLKSRSATTGAD